MKKVISDKKILMTVLSIILVLVVMSSTTYALFFKVHTMDNTESYTAGILDIKVEEGSKLELVNSLPITDEEGANLISYTFTITNVGNLTYTFDLKLLSTTTENQINPNYIKIKLDDKEPVLLSSLSEGIINNDLTLNPEESITMSIRIWLSIDTPNTEIGKTFSAKIVTDGVGSEYVKQNTGADYIESLLTSNPETMNNNDPDSNVRYMGKNPNNYVSFNNELWRIIGVFKDIDDGTGKKEKRIKIARSESIGTNTWDSNGVNEWSTATLNSYLNNDYLNSINFESRTMVDNAVWKLGGYNPPEISARDFYTYERGTIVYPGRSIEWTGEIALMYPSDYLYSTSLGDCEDYYASSWNSKCAEASWIFSGQDEWLLTPNPGYSNFSFHIVYDGTIYYYVDVYDQIETRPILYLKSTVQITGGDGTKTNPYILSMYMDNIQ